MQELTSKKLRRYFLTFPLRNYHRGQILIYNEDQPTDAYMVQAGRVRQYTISDEGNEVVVDVFRKNAIFPNFLMFMAHKPSEYFFEAMSDIQVNIVPMAKLLEFLKMNPDVVMNLFLETQEASEKMLRRMTYVMASTAYYRLAYELVLECQLNPVATKGHYKIPIHEYELANQAGVSRETANRELKKLKNKGIVSVNRKYITVKNFFKLKKELGTHI